MFSKAHSRIIFIGTPEFAVASLKAMVETGYNVVAVVTAVDKPAGRGLKMQESPVKAYAVQQGIPVLQPVNQKDPAFLEELRSYRADLQVVIAFRMMPEAVWNMPPLGTFNLHASLLPQYRGAAPINRAIMNGETVTGVSTFFLKHEIDTGDILYREEVPIGPDETAGELHDKLMHIGAAAVIKTLQLIEAGQVKGTPQPTSPDLKTAPKIFKQDCLIDWNRPVQQVYNQVRGLSPYPAAFTTLQDKTLKIYKARPVKGKPASQPGGWETDGKSYLRFACADGYLDLLEVQAEGKKRMPVDEFLRGFRA